jgi:hypothetical protein
MEDFETFGCLGVRIGVDWGSCRMGLGSAELRGRAEGFHEARALSLSGDVQKFGGFAIGQTLWKPFLLVYPGYVYLYYNVHFAYLLEGTESVAPV